MEIQFKKLVKKCSVDGVDFTVEVRLFEKLERIDIVVKWSQKNRGFVMSFDYTDQKSLVQALESVDKRLKAVAECLNGWHSVISFLEEFKFDLVKS